MAPHGILSLAQDVCDRVTVNVPTTLFGTNDRIARILRLAAKDTIRDIMRAGQMNGLQGFHSQWIFATRPGVYAYVMPTDFLRILPGTEQRNSWPLGLIGPVSPQTWAGWIAGVESVVTPMSWRIKNNLIHIEPPPVAAEIVMIEYLSRFPVARNATDDDLLPVDGYLQPIAPLVPREGYLSSDAYSTIEVTGSSEWGSATWGTAVWGTTPHGEVRRIPAGTSNTSFPAYQVRAEEFTSDTDTSALDDDHVLSLGMTWRLRKGLSMPYAEDRDEYEREKDVFVANDASRARTFEIGNSVSHYDVAPLGGGRWMVG